MQPVQSAQIADHRRQSAFDVLVAQIDLSHPPVVEIENPPEEVGLHLERHSHIQPVPVVHIDGGAGAPSPQRMIHSQVAVACGGPVVLQSHHRPAVRPANLCRQRIYVSAVGAPRRIQQHDSRHLLRRSRTIRSRQRRDDDIGSRQHRHAHRSHHRRIAGIAHHGHPEASRAQNAACGYRELAAGGVGAQIRFPIAPLHRSETAMHIRSVSAEDAVAAVCGHRAQINSLGSPRPDAHRFRSSHDAQHGRRPDQHRHRPCIGIAAAGSKRHRERRRPLRPARSSREAAARARGVAHQLGEAHMHIRSVIASHHIAAVAQSRIVVVAEQSGKVKSLGGVDSHRQIRRQVDRDVGGLPHIHRHSRVQSAPAGRAQRHSKRSRSVRRAAGSHSEAAARVAAAHDPRDRAGNPGSILASHRIAAVRHQSPYIYRASLAQSDSRSRAERRIDDARSRPDIEPDHPGSSSAARRRIAHRDSLAALHRPSSNREVAAVRHDRAEQRIRRQVGSFVERARDRIRPVSRVLPHIYHLRVPRPDDDVGLRSSKADSRISADIDEEVR